MNNYAQGGDKANAKTNTTPETLSPREKLETATYWNTNLTGLEPCHFPRLSQQKQQHQKLQHQQEQVDVVNVAFDIESLTNIQSFCEANKITPSSLCQSAWALVLASYTGNDSVCFGYTTDAEKTLRVCQTTISPESTTVEFVQNLNAQISEHLNQQSCSLSELEAIAQSLQQPLFNTIVSVENATLEDSSASKSASSVSLTL